MYFNEKFNIDSIALKEYGAVNISFQCDMPLFIDPMLIFNSEKLEYANIHKNIIKYMQFLAKKSAERSFNEDEIKTYFKFNEVYQNWLGYCIKGNKGCGLGVPFANSMANSISEIVNTNNISDTVHIEKATLMFTQNSGKDAISDFTANLIIGFLAEYTEKFAKDYIDPKFCEKFYVDKSEFNYETSSFISKEYYLPFIIDEKGKYEYVLLTPKDILRVDECSINRKDFRNSYKEVRNSIPNCNLRTELDSYIVTIVRNHENSSSKKRKTSERTIEGIEKKAFIKFAEKNIKLYDYYIKYKENNFSNDLTEAESEREYVELLFEKVAKKWRDILSITDVTLSSKDECIKKVGFLKNEIENCGLYKDLYKDGKPVNEKNLQRLYRLTWCDSSCNFDSEVNNGNGPVDFKVSNGKIDQTICEFKLASTTSLKYVNKQVDAYLRANRIKNKVIVIFFFNEKERDLVFKILKENSLIDLLDNDIFMIDCRRDNKVSASNERS